MEEPAVSLTFTPLPEAVTVFDEASHCALPPRDFTIELYGTSVLPLVTIGLASRLSCLPSRATLMAAGAADT
nr:hypothetical protein [Paenibacillus humicus]